MLAIQGSGPEQSQRKTGDAVNRAFAASPVRVFVPRQFFRFFSVESARCVRYSSETVSFFPEATGRSLRTTSLSPPMRLYRLLRSSGRLTPEERTP